MTTYSETEKATAQQKVGVTSRKMLIPEGFGSESTLLQFIKVLDKGYSLGVSGWMNG